MKARKSSRSLGVDTSQPVTQEWCEKIKNIHKCHFIARYLPRRSDVRYENPGSTSNGIRNGSWRGCYVISRFELSAIMAAELDFVPVQFAPRGADEVKNWEGDTIDEKGGRKAGRAAAEYAKWLGIPAGVHLWCDMEGPLVQAASPTKRIDCVQGWAAEANDLAYRCGFYDGGIGLTPRQLWLLEGVTAYWTAAVWTRTPDVRAWNMIQTLSEMLYGVPVDFDVAKIDDKGERFFWCAP